MQHETKVNPPLPILLINLLRWITQISLDQQSWYPSAIAHMFQDEGFVIWIRGRGDPDRKHGIFVLEQIESSWVPYEGSYDRGLHSRMDNSWSHRISLSEMSLWWPSYIWLQDRSHCLDSQSHWHTRWIAGIKDNPIWKWHRHYLKLTFSNW